MTSILAPRACKVHIKNTSNVSVEKRKSSRLSAFQEKSKVSYWKPTIADAREGISTPCQGLIIQN